jgi:hypothetical protein
LSAIHGIGKSPIPRLSFLTSKPQNPKTPKPHCCKYSQRID